jgi:stress response protein YsnF
VGGLRSPDSRWRPEWTTIITLLEEMAVVEERLRAIEEVCITSRQTTRQAPQHVTLRREEALVERLEVAGRGD